MKTLLLACALIASAAPAPAEPVAPPCSAGLSADACAVEQLERDIALVLAREGFAAYAARFHPGYSNWGDGGAPLARAEFLAAVKGWHQRGNHAVAVRMVPLSTEVLGDFALSRYRLREDFSDGTSFVGHFTSLAARHEGQWLLYRTSFTTLYRGPAAGAPNP
jgi:hypothetical protein